MTDQPMPDRPHSQRPVPGDPDAFAALAAASSAMLHQHHVSDVLAHLMTDCLGPMTAHAAAILVVDGSELTLLCASTHRAAEIEMLQTQETQGPCIEAIDTGEVVSAVGEQALVDRWDRVGPAIYAAGYASVHAFPMRWHGQVLGGLNIFRTEDDDQGEDTEQIGQAFADVATLVLVQATEVPVDQVAARVRDAVAARSVVEQAKGVLAYLHDLDMEQAYELLLHRSTEDHGSLTETALRVVRDQHA
jgi:transcriptional regulator with GAF, ATPase, and Fis domain